MWPKGFSQAYSHKHTVQGNYDSLSEQSVSNEESVEMIVI